MSLDGRKFLCGIPAFLGNLEKYVNLLQSYHSHVMESQLFRFVLLSIYQRGWREDGWRGLEAEPTENFLKPCPLLWTRMHLPSVLSVTKNFDCS